MKYKLTEELIKDLANKSPEVKEIFKKHFPKLFEDEKYFIFREAHSMFNEDCKRVLQDAGLNDRIIQVRSEGNFINREFYLDNCVKWEIVKDCHG